MRIAVRRLGLGVSEQLADHVQALAEAGGDRGEAVAQVVEPQIVQSRAVPEPPPGLLQVDEMRRPAWRRAAPSPTDRAAAAQHVDRGARSDGRPSRRSCCRAGAGSGAARSTCSQRRVRISDNRQPVNTSSRMAAIDLRQLGAGVLGLAQRRAQPRHLVGRQVPLALAPRGSGRRAAPGWCRPARQPQRSARFIIFDTSPRTRLA